MVRLLALAALLGVVASAAASAFIEVVALGQQWLFTDLPRPLGLGGLPWWWVAILLVVGSGIVLLARRMPGATGPGPLTGFISIPGWPTPRLCCLLRWAPWYSASSSGQRRR